MIGAPLVCFDMAVGWGICTLQVGAVVHIIQWLKPMLTDPDIVAADCTKLTGHGRASQVLADTVLNCQVIGSRSQVWIWQQAPMSLPEPQVVRDMGTTDAIIGL